MSRAKNKSSFNFKWREVIWHRPFKLDQVTNMLTHLAATINRGAVVWEIRATEGSIRYLLGVDERYIYRVSDEIKVHGDVELRDIEPNIRAEIKSARKLRTTKPTLSLRKDIAESTIRAGLAALAETKSGEESVIQIILGKSYAPHLLPKNPVNPNATWLDYVLGHSIQASSEMRKSMKEKADQYTFDCVIRIGVTDNAASYRISNILSAIRTLETAGIRIYSDKEKPENLNSTHLPWSFPMRLSCTELTSFFMLPAGVEELPGTLGLHPRMTYPPDWYYLPKNAARQRIFANSMNGINSKPLSISPESSLEHTILIGPTGSGKSTAMLNLILSDIYAGRSVLVLDPKADLITSILERIPESRADDVIVIDPSDANPVGFNPLSLPGDPNLIADAVLAVFHEIFSENWGIRTQDVLGSALMTLCATPNSSLLWLPSLLNDADFRAEVIRGVNDPIALRPFWEQFNNLNPRDREQWIAPVLNKLRQFLLRPGLRGVLGQANPKFQLTDLFYKRRIVLVPLNKGVIGADSAKLLGSLIVGLTWTLALSRANIPPERRHLVSLYIDELQDYLALPTDLADALAQARGLGVGITMAHQYRGQITGNVLPGIDANARNKIVFGLSSNDAYAYSQMAPDLKAEDFMSLPRYEIYTNFMFQGKQTGWVRGKTLAAPPVLHTAAEIKAMSQVKYGKSRDEVDNEFLNILPNSPDENPPDQGNISIGRRVIE